MDQQKNNKAPSAKRPRLSTGTDSGVIRRSSSSSRKSQHKLSKEVLFSQCKIFEKRMAAIYSAWRACETERNDEQAPECDLDEIEAILISSPAELTTTLEPQHQMGKENAVSKWLFGGEEITNTILFLSKTAIFVITSKTKEKYFSPILNSESRYQIPPVRFLNRSNPHAFESSILKGHVQSAAGKVVGVVRGLPLGKSVSPWLESITNAAMTVETISLCALVTHKTKDETAAIQKAADLAARCLQDLESACSWFYEHREEVTPALLIDELKEKHFQGANQSRYRFLYPPIIESGGATCGIKPRDNEKVSKTTPAIKRKFISFDCVIMSVGVQHIGLCGNFARTILFDPSPNLIACYTLLSKIRDCVIKSLKSGRRASSVYNNAVSFLRREDASLVPHFSRSVGHSIGFRFKEHTILNSECDAVLSYDQTFNVQVAFVGIISKMASVTLVLADTVTVDSALEPLDMKTLIVKKRRGLPYNSSLPIEVVELVFAYLDPMSLGRACQVCRQWSNVGWTFVDFSSVRSRVRWKRVLFTSTKISSRFLNVCGPIVPPTVQGAATNTLVLGGFSKLRHASIQLLNFSECEHILTKDLKVLPHFSKLRKLNLNFTGIEGLGHTAIASYLKSPKCVLQELELAGTRITSTCLAALKTGLDVNTSLSFLRLQENPIGDVGAKILAEIVAETTTLKRIPLGPITDAGSLYSCTLISPVGQTAIIQALSGNTSIGMNALHAPKRHSRGFVGLGRWSAKDNVIPRPNARGRDANANANGDDDSDGDMLGMDVEGEGHEDNFPAHAFVENWGRVGRRDGDEDIDDDYDDDSIFSDDIDANNRYDHDDTVKCKICGEVAKCNAHSECRACNQDNADAHLNLKWKAPVNPAQHPIRKPRSSVNRHASSNANWTLVDPVKTSLTSNPATKTTTTTTSSTDVNTNMNTNSSNISANNTTTTSVGIANTNTNTTAKATSHNLLVTHTMAQTQTTSQASTTNAIALLKYKQARKATYRNIDTHDRQGITPPTPNANQTASVVQTQTQTPTIPNASTNRLTESTQSCNNITITTTPPPQSPTQTQTRAVSPDTDATTTTNATDTNTNTADTNTHLTHTNITPSTTGTVAETVTNAHVDITSTHTDGAGASNTDTDISNMFSLAYLREARLKALEKRNKE